MTNNPQRPQVMSELEQKAREAAERWFKDEWAALAKATDDQKEGESIHSWAADIESREDALACHIADTFAATAVGDAEGVDVFQREPADFCELAGDCKRCIQPGNCTCTHHAPTDQCHEFIPAQRCYLSAGHEGVHFSEDVVPDGRVAEDDVTKARAELREMWPGCSFEVRRRFNAGFYKKPTEHFDIGVISTDYHTNERVDSADSLAEAMAKVRQFKADCVFTEGVVEEQNN